MRSAASSPDEVVDELLAGAKTEEEIFGPGGVFGQLTKRLVERALEVELTDHLGYELHAEPPGGTGNTRNGGTPKTLMTEHGPVPIQTPRDREGSFEPKLVKKRQRRFEGFDEKILALYSRGLSTRDIERYLRELYGVNVGRDLISRVTDAVMDDARAWQQRPLADVYPIIFLDAFVLKINEGGSVQRKAASAGWPQPSWKSLSQLSPTQRKTDMNSDSAWSGGYTAEDYYNQVQKPYDDRRGRRTVSLCSPHA
jgi:transposase-like protein